MQVVTDTYVDFILRNFFKEDKFVRTNCTVSDWREKPRMIQPREIFSHFQGSYYVGFICRDTPIDILVFDLDSNSTEASRTITNRIRRVKENFGNPDFIYTSPNDGYHLYYHLDRSYHPKEIRSIVKSIIRIRAGEIEFFPNGRGLRLFGGQKCKLLDHKLRQTPIDPEEYVQNVWVLNESLNLSDFKSNPDILFSNSFIQKCEQFAKYGLKSSSSRNDALLDLNRYYQGFQNQSPEETEETLVDWMKNKNNGFSKDWKRNPRGVIKQIHAIVVGYDKKKFTRSPEYSFPHHLLSHDDLKIIHNLSLDLAKSIQLEMHQIYEFLIDLIAHCKYHNESGIVEIPRSLFQSCKYGSGKRYKKIKDALEKSGVLVQKENYSTTSHKCIKYKLLEELC